VEKNQFRKPIFGRAMKATRKAIELAEEFGLELDSIDGTGKDGKITVADVKQADRDQSMGERPADIAGRGIRIWNEVKRFLEDEEIWQPVFGEVLANYVRAVLLAAEARMSVAKSGPVTTGSQGQIVAHPNVKLRRDAELDVLKYAQALLITPEAHKRIAGSTEDDDEDLGF